MSDFIDFIADYANDQNTGKQLLNMLTGGTTKEALQKWFRDLGYDVTLQECQELIDKKGNFTGISGSVNNNVKY